MQCELCGRSGVQLEKHHIFGGARRKLSERYALTVKLCHHCHNEPPSGVHHNAEAMEALHKLGQRRVMARQGWSVEEFRAVFWKNYLSEGELDYAKADDDAGDFRLHEACLPVFAL